MSPSSPLPSGVRFDLLDCIQSNLAVLGARPGVPDAWLGLGRLLPGLPRRLPTGLPTVDPEFGVHVARCAAAVGLDLADLTAVVRAGPGGTAAALRAASGAHAGPLYVVADAHDMPWLPYHRRAHMPHSFLVTADGDGGERALVSDGYLNETPWGRAAPGRWTHPWSDLPAPLAVHVVRGHRADPGPASPAWDPEVVDGYVTAFADHPDREAAWSALTVETWLLARAHGLHHEFRRAAGTATADTGWRAASWSDVAARAFLTARRVARGRREPADLLPTLRTLLHAADDPVAA